jgi:gliding motility-associated-like protein
VIKKQNEAPVITGQQAVSMNQGASVTIDLSHLIVTDPDNRYPTGFTLKVFAGNNYAFKGTAVTPSANFSGQLTVPVTVNDGENESNSFDLKIDVIKKQNEAPVITGQKPLSVNQGGILTIEFSHLIVNDPDNTYPTSFTLKVFGGNNYTFNETTITPSPNFSGQLTIPVTVNDGQSESNRFDLKIDVIKKQNVAPVITGQGPLSVDQGESLTIALGHLTVTDSDNTYPTGFTLKVFAGNNYTSTGSTITPSANFSGQLTVPVTVNDGENESNRFNLKVNVIKKQNEAPVITGQQSLSMDQGASLTIQLPHLIVTDSDNSYPTGFTLKVFGGNNYAFNGTTVTPSANFSGQLTVPVTVNDGANESNSFDLKIDVIKKQNEAPVITGQGPLSVDQGESLTIALGHLTVTDPDNTYPTGFTLKVFAGNNYTFNGTTVTPSANFSGQLTVPVTVNDGANESNRFALKINVIKKQNEPPIITGQQSLSMDQDASLTIQLAHLIVTDSDNSYPTGFTLKVFGGNNYAFNGTTITPSANFSGPLTVPVTVSDGVNESNRFDLKVNVIKKQNKAPVITGQKPLSVNQGESLTIEFGHLTVTDSDNTYPTGFILKVFNGNNYAFNGTTITPSANFSGQLTVPVTVNDGANESNSFNLKVNVIKKQNEAPVITGQKPLNVNQGGSLTIEFSHLIVTDPDNTYPTGFTLKVFPGINFSLTGSTITPSPTSFIGTLTATVTVNDGQHESNFFYLKIDVLKTQNLVPQITGQQALKINEEETFTLQPGILSVVDPDNVYPKDFSFKISEGLNYKISGLTIIPVQDFSGGLTVPVIINDGKNDSAPYNLKIEVAPVNDAPRISGQVPLTTNKNTLISLALSDLTVTDPDNKYPEGFTLKILPGDNYSFAANIVSPAPDFTGILNVAVMTNDGKANSPEFALKIEVVSPVVNIPPTITGQKSIRITQNTAVTLQLSHLIVTDPDNEYPHGFTLKVFPGSNYTVDGTTVTPPAAVVNGTFAVMVKVNDGQDDSEPFEVKIQVIPPTAKPQINGQKELTVLEDSTLTITLTDLIVTDADDPNYPAGFLLIVLPNDGVYTRNGNSITPVSNLNGFIDVGIIISDGTNPSEEFKLAILVEPVNDPPEFLLYDTTALAYKPGHDPLPIFETLNLRDVDDDYLILAEIGFEAVNYNPKNDQCIFPSDISPLRSVHDADGRLFLIGYATIDDYLKALRSIQYNYVLTQDDNGNPAEILAGPRKLYLTVSDRHLGNARYQRTITIEIEISLDIPNAFTPNGDQQNDTWHIDLINADRIDDALIKVYDKRGMLLYEAIGFENEWDGSSNGQMLPMDTYYYTIDLNLSYMKKTYKGSVTILH